ncbi:MAG: beta-galactosidase [Alistipes sp.]|nr:beta-galactosidase [Alistipes sp.]
MKRWILYILLTVSVVSSGYAREIYSLNSGWKFFYAEENSSDNAREISLPHTWNLDAFVGNGTYLQTSANYQRTLFVPSEWKGKRLFLRFHGVQSVADVFINGRHIGDHHGGYTAFTFEITDKVSYGYNNALLVAVSNALRNDVLPTSIEENRYGGIYRDVELLVTEKTAVSPLYYGTDGIMVHQTDVSKERVSGRVDVALLGKKDSSHNVTVDFLAPDGYVSLSKTVKAKIDDNLLSVPFTIENAELWSLGSPRLYTVRVTIDDESVEVKTGFRKIEVTSEKKFTINGRRVRVRGVLLGHDRMPKGNAVSKSEINSDLALIREMGANAVRSVAGPHAQHLYNECDRLGMVAWVDFPFARAPFLSDIPYYSTPRFEMNGVQQLHEIVLQNINHPSVAMWGVFSMLRGNSKQQMDYIRKLNSTAKKLDATRPTVAMSNQDGDINFITDLIVWQQAVGWENGEITDLDLWQGALRTSWNHLRQAVCYGESSNGMRFSSATAVGCNNSVAAKARQQRFHEGYSHLVDEDLFWGVWLNSMFDMGSARYVRGVRNSGVVAGDHKSRKNLFYLYKSQWNRRQPTLHITDKERDIRSEESQVLTIYSSLGRPVLTINGDTVACENVARTIYRTDTLKLKGTNTVKASVADKEDEMTLTIGNYSKVQ